MPGILHDPHTPEGRGLGSLLQCSDPLAVSPPLHAAPGQEQEDKSCSRRIVTSPGVLGPATGGLWALECQDSTWLNTGFDSSWQARTFRRQISIVSSHFDTIMSSPYTCSDIFMKSLHPNQRSRELDCCTKHSEKHGLFFISKYLIPICLFGERNLRSNTL